MAIEPISSAMTFQVQPYQATQTARPVEKPVAEYTESTAQNAQQIDGNTIVIPEAEGKEEGADQNPSQGGGYLQSQKNEKDKGEVKQPSNDTIKKAVEELNKKMYNSEALYGIHEGTNRVTIKIVDKDTKEVIKELPPEKTLDMIAKAWELAGLMVDERR